MNTNVLFADEEKPPKNNCLEPAELQDWTKKDKFLLLQAIKKFGSQNFKEISKKIPSQSEANIQRAIQYYTEKAVEINKGISKPTINKTKRKSQLQNMQYLKLTEWVEYLRNSMNLGNLHTDFPTALRMVAEFEDFPSPEVSENVDFKKLYNTVADAMEGKPLPDDPFLKSIVEKCIIEIGLVSKTLMTKTTLRQVAKTITTTDKNTSSFPIPTTDHEVAAIRCLTFQQAYNPLNIAETHLKFP